MAPSIQSRKVWLTPTTRVSCSNAAKTRSPLNLKLAGVPQTEPISAVIVGQSSPYCGDVWGRYCCLTSFFWLSIRALVTKNSPTLLTYLLTYLKLCDGAQKANFWRFLRPVFSASRVQHVSTKATPCVEVWLTSNMRVRRLRLGEEKRRKEDRRRNHRANI